MAGSSHVGRVLPGDAAAAAPDARSTAVASPCCSVSASSPRRCCSGAPPASTCSPPRCTAQMSQTPDRLRHRRGPRLAAARVRHRRRGRPEDAARRPAPLRHPRRQGVPLAGPPVQARRRRARGLQHRGDRPAGRRADHRLAVPGSGAPRSTSASFTLDNYPRRSSTVQRHRGDLQQRHDLAARRADLPARSASSPPRSSCAGRRYRHPAHRRSTSSSRCRSAFPPSLFGAGFLLTYTEGPFVLYGTRWVIVLVYVTLMLPFATRMQLAGMVVARGQLRRGGARQRLGRGRGQRQGRPAAAALGARRRRRRSCSCCSPTSSPRRCSCDHRRRR